MNTLRYSRIYITLCVTTGLAGFGATAATAAELLVPQQFPTIQAAIDAAVDGDEVIVSAGSYLETIDFGGKTIAVRSVDGAVATTIDGGGQDVFVVTVANGEAPGTRLEGFTITGGLGAKGPSFGNPGGGVLLRQAALEVVDCTFVGNTGSQGGGISADEATLVVRGSRFEDHFALRGAAIDAWLSDLQVENAVFVNNESATNGGAIAVGGGQVEVVEATFTENHAGSFGSALFLNTTFAQLDGLTVLNNGRVEATGLNSKVYFSFAGAGIYTTHTAGLIANSTFRGNASVRGAGLYLASSTDLTVASCLIADNDGATGAALFVNTGDPLLVNLTVANNPNGLFAYYNSQPRIVGSIFTNNSSNFGWETAGQGNTQVAYSLLDGDVFSATLGPGVLQNVAPQLDAEFRPLAGSPVIDAGDSTVFPSSVTVDLAGNPRFVDDPDTPDTGTGTPPFVDLGAFEFQVAQVAAGTCRGDLNCDGAMTPDDIIPFVTALSNWSEWRRQYADCSALNADVNGDGVANADDITPFIALLSSADNADRMCDQALQKRTNSRRFDALR